MPIVRGVRAVVLFRRRGRATEVRKVPVAQGELFAAPAGDAVRSPICMRQKHCGSSAVLGKPEEVEPGCVNRSITCLACGATGVQSTNEAVSS